MKEWLNQLEAGQSALKNADWQKAKAYFEAVLRETEVPEARDGLGMALWWLNEISAAHEHRTRAYLGYKERGEFKRAAYLAAWLAREQVFYRANVSAMRGWFSRAESLLEGDQNSLERGWLEIYKASMGAASRDLEEIATRVMEQARRLHNADLEVFSLVNAGYACVAMGHVKKGMRFIDEAMAAATSGEVTDPYVTTETFCVTLSACEMAGDFVRTRHWCEVAMDYAERYNSPFLSAYCRTTYGGVLAATGRWQEAEIALTEAIQAFDAGHQALRVHAVLILADLRVSQGRLEEADVLLAGYEDQGGAVLPLARLHLARGEVALARAILDHALQITSSPLSRASLLRLLAEVLLVLGDMDGAKTAAGELAEVAQKAGSDILAAQARLAMGQVKRFTGEHGAANDLHAALDHLQAFEQSLLAGRTKLELARTLLESDKAAAIMWARAALACFERIGAPHDAHEAGQVLRSLGVAGRAGGRQTKPLTQRETEVLNLVAHGLTNREIAERLVISAKTVEHHVGHILTKLNLRSRAEAAAYAARLLSPKENRG